MATTFGDFGVEGYWLSTAELEKLVKKARLGARYDAVLAGAQIGFRALAKPTAREPGRMASKWGGAPDLPTSVDVPASLSFIAQIDLARLPTRPLALAGLPTGGLLSFFYDLGREPSLYDEPSETPWALVTWTPSSETCVRRPLSDRPVLPACEMKLLPEITLPSSESSDAIAALGFGPTGAPAGYASALRDEDRRYGKLCSAIDEQASTLHRFLGHSSPVQGNLQLEAELFSRGKNPGSPAGYEGLPNDALATSRRFRLLLQVDSCEHLEWSWGDEGRLYFLIAEEDLREKRFDRVLVHWQSH